MSTARPEGSPLAAVAPLDELLPLSGAPVHLDLGTGLGHFVVALAARHPDANWIGLERDGRVIARAARRARSASVGNVAFVRADARPFLLEAVEPASLDHLWLNFPDPWPKDRHAARRHTHPWMIGLMLDRLKLGGELHLKTDAAPYLDEFRAAMAARSEVTEAAGSAWRRDGLGVATKYERKWLEAGRTIPAAADWRKTAVTDPAPYRVTRVAAPDVRVPALPTPGTYAHDGRLLKVFRPRRDRPEQARVLWIDPALGLETPGHLRLPDEVVLHGIWTPWKAAVLRAVLTGEAALAAQVDQDR